MTRLDLGDETESPPVRASGRHLLLQPGDVIRSLHKAVSDHVDLAHGEVERFKVGRHQRGEPEIGIGEIQPLLGLQLGAFGPGPQHPHEHSLVPKLLHLALQLAIVEPHGLARGEPVQDLRERAGSSVGKALVVGQRPSDKQQAVARLETPVLGAHDLAGAAGRTGEVEQDAQIPTARSACATHVRHHAHPEVRRVVSAVDAGDVHTAPCQVDDQIRVFGRLRPKGHHDRSAPPLATAKQLSAVTLEQPLTAIKGARAGERRLVAGMGGERRNHGIQIRQHAGLEATERRQPQQGELVLQVTQFAATQRQIVRKVGRTELEGLTRGTPPPAIEHLFPVGCYLSPELSESGE